MQKLVNFVSLSLQKHPFLWSGLLVFLVTCLAYGRILGMFFYLEDYLILYSIQHPESPQAGYGSGVIGRPYGYAVTPFIPFYHLFGLEPLGYYVVEIFLYFLAALAVYFFTKTLTANRGMALGSALIFASGYVGSGSLYRLAVGWQNILAAALISLSAALYFKYAKNPKVKYYLLALIVYLFTSEFSFYRAHGIILLILGIELIFNFKWFISIFRVIPFMLSYWYFYIYSIPFMGQESKAASFFTAIQASYRLVLTPLKTLENLFIPDRFNFPFLVFVGILFGILFWKRSKILVYCLIFAVANYLVYFYNTPASVQETTHRYLTVSFVGTAAFWGIFIGYVSKRREIYVLLCLIVVLLNLTLAKNEQKEILQNRSQPDREFWQSFRNQVQVLPSHSVIYIDTKNDGLSKPVRDTALSAGSMSATASFAVFYGLKWDDVLLAEDFPELLGYLRSGKVIPDNIYTFFYSRQNGLINTTELSKKTLTQGDSFNINNPSKIDLAFSSPLLLSFSSDVKLDFSESGKESVPNLKQYLDYFSSRAQYYREVVPSASSEVKHAEVKNIVDKDPGTTWRADDLKWAAGHHEEVILNLGKERLVGAIRMIPGHPLRVPTKYSWACSRDSKTWTELTSIEKNTSDVGGFVDRFDSQDCVYVKLTISKTVSGPPQISEIEVIENKFSGLDFNRAEKIEEDPFTYMPASEEKSLTGYLSQNGVFGRICFYTDKYNHDNPKCKKYNLRLGISKQNSILIDQGGTVLQKIEILVPGQVKVKLKNVQAKFLTFDELTSDSQVAKDGQFRND